MSVLRLQRSFRSFLAFLSSRVARFAFSHLKSVKSPLRVMMASGFSTISSSVPPLALFTFAPLTVKAVSYTHLTLPTNREV